MILIATLLLVSVSMASTTFPKVPCPKRRTVLSFGTEAISVDGAGDDRCILLTTLVDHVVGPNDIVTFLVVARLSALRDLFESETMRRHGVSTLR